MTDMIKAAVDVREQKQNNMRQAVRCSVVSVYFAERNQTLSYYNDRFELQCGDLVHVNGKLKGVIGRVTEVCYKFKIKLSEYKRVIGVVDTKVQGRLYLAGSHLVAFDRAVLPRGKVLAWFCATAENEKEEYVFGSDDEAFALQDLTEMNVSPAIAKRGCEYYMANKVRYICLDGVRGYAIVAGNNIYEVEFDCEKGKISNLVCSCFCSYDCKHEVAAMYQLRETLELIHEQYADEYEKTGYFATIYKGTFFAFAIDGKKKGSFTLD